MHLTQHVLRGRSSPDEVGEGVRSLGPAASYATLMFYAASPDVTKSGPHGSTESGFVKSAMVRPRARQ